jgi:ABC-type multidrug transport system fused ATPase/permease subunit
MIMPLTFIISISVGNVIKFGEVIELMALVGRIRWPMECIKNMQRKIVSIKIDMMRTEEFLSQPEINRKIENPKFPDYAVHIENKSFSWGVKTVDVQQQYEKMSEAMEVRWCSRKKEKTEEEKKEEDRRWRELTQNWKLSKAITLHDITLKVKKGQFVCIIGETGSGKSSLLSTLCGELLPVPK